MIRYRFGALVAAIIVAAGCQSSLTPGPSQPSSAAVSPTPSTALAAPSSSPSASPLEPPSPADVTAAGALVEQYTAHLVHGQFTAAWTLLDPWSRQFYGSFAAYTEDQRGYFRSIAGRYTVVPNATGLGPITDWLPSSDGPTVDLNRAVLVEVDYPNIAFANQWDAYVVARDASRLRLFEVR